MCFNIRSPEPQTHLGLPGKAFLITIVFAKIKKSKQKKNKTKTSKQKKSKKRKKEKSHILASTSNPLEGRWLRVPGPPWEALFLSSALQCGMVLVGYGSGRVAKAVGTGQGV